MKKVVIFFTVLFVSLSSFATQFCTSSLMSLEYRSFDNEEYVAVDVDPVTYAVYYQKVDILISNASKLANGTITIKQAVKMAERDYSIIAYYSEKMPNTLCEKKVLRQQGRRY